MKKKKVILVMEVGDGGEYVQIREIKHKKKREK